MVIHSLWTTDTGHCVVASRVEAAVPELGTVVDIPWARGWAAALNLFVQRRPEVEQPWQKLTVLLPGANSSATLNRACLDTGVRC